MSANPWFRDRIKKETQSVNSASLKIQAIKLKLLELNLSACSLELLLDLVSLSLRSSLLDGLRSGVNLLLSFLQAQAGDLADNLDNTDLRGASVNQNDVEVGLSLSSSSTVTKSRVEMALIWGLTRFFVMP